MLKTPLTLFIDFLKSNKEMDMESIILVATEMRDSAEKHELIRTRMGDYPENMSAEEFESLYLSALNWYKERYQYVEEKEEKVEQTSAE